MDELTIVMIIIAVVVVLVIASEVSDRLLSAPVDDTDDGEWWETLRSDEPIKPRPRPLVISYKTISLGEEDVEEEARDIEEEARDIEEEARDIEEDVLPVMNEVVESWAYKIANPEQLVADDDVQWVDESPLFDQLMGTVGDRMARTVTEGLSIAREWARVPELLSA